jgi:nicotinate-nucleotide adenylyltransferase
VISLGVLGGTFDPIHNGHIHVAQVARDQLGVDRVLLTVANDPWQKSSTRSVTPAAIRLQMCRAAVDGLDGVIVDDREIIRGGQSYSIDTVNELRVELGDVDVCLIIGADVAGSLPTWHRAAELAQLVDVVVVNRGGDGQRVDSQTLNHLGELGWSNQQLAMEPMAVSATEIRDRVARGQAVDHLVPGGVARIIGDLGLYAGTPHDKPSI